MPAGGGGHRLSGVTRYKKIARLYKQISVDIQFFCYV
jgi:hypothetical protein